MLSIFLVNISFAQEATDALRFAQTGHGGTARHRPLEGRSPHWEEIFHQRWSTRLDWPFSKPTT